MMRRAKILQLHFSEEHRFEGKPLYEEVVRACREMGIAGATVLRGLEGYGETAAIHGEPIVVLMVDDDERISALLPVVERMMGTGMITISDGEVVRVKSH